jgi:hypothetical protein
MAKANYFRTWAAAIAATVAAMLAMALMTTPAMAQPFVDCWWIDDDELVCFDGVLVGDQEAEIEEAESGDIDSELVIENTGDSVNFSGAVLQDSNTGNVQNIQTVNQSGVGESGDIELEGSSIELGSELDSGSNQSVRQTGTVR